MPIDSTSPVGGARPIAPLDARLLQRSGGPRAQAQPASADGSVVVASEARDAGPVPIDNDRVVEIRKAVETGTYPLVPAKVADAIIAAGMLLRSPK
ncbi:flagellar biosynthesis anti-sigma factor FlgM [Novosphingobium sp. MW5]|nr:flagellar biosynthesis anti-sigma factor FlgM [Novosphingobium sp. MW5]